MGFECTLTRNGYVGVVQSATPADGGVVEQTAMRPSVVSCRITPDRKSRGVPTRQTAEEFVSFRVRTNTVLLTAGT